VHRDPAREAHADRANLRDDGVVRDADRCVLRAIEVERAGIVLVDPDSDEVREHARGDAVLRRERAHDRAEIGDVAADVAAIGLEVDDRVRHELTRPVIRDVAAAPGFEERDALRRALLGADDDVLALRAAAEGDDGVVLEEEQRIADLSGDALLDEAFLEAMRFVVADPTEPVRGDGASRRHPALDLACGR